MPKRLKILFFIFVSAGFTSYSQTRPFTIEIRELGQKETYRLTIHNTQDSILYFLTCGFLYPKQYRIDTAIQFTPVKLDVNSYYHYTPQYTSANNEISIEAPFYKAIAILPYQFKTFDFKVTEITELKILELDYFVLRDYNHNAFNAEIIYAMWFTKYNIRKHTFAF